MADSGVKIIRKPKQPFAYQGNQVIINTDRIVMQSKHDSILMFANEHLSFSANQSIHFDTSDADTSYFIINSPKMIFGLENNLDSDNTCAWTSRPITTSYFFPFLSIK